MRTSPRLQFGWDDTARPPEIRDMPELGITAADIMSSQGMARRQTYHVPAELSYGIEDIQWPCW